MNDICIAACILLLSISFSVHNWPLSSLSFGVRVAIAFVSANTFAQTFVCVEVYVYKILVAHLSAHTTFIHFVMCCCWKYLYFAQHNTTKIKRKNLSHFYNYHFPLSPPSLKSCQMTAISLLWQHCASYFALCQIIN